MTLHVIILIKSVFKKNQNHYYYNIFLKKNVVINYPKITINNTKYVFVENIYFEKIDISEGIDLNKTSKSKEGDIYHYWYFFLIKGWGFNQMPAMNVMMY